LSGRLDELVRRIEGGWPGFLARLSADPLSSLVLVIGSWARYEAGPLSDVDLLVVTRSEELAGINALHCFEESVPSIDLLFVAESALHDGSLSLYERHSLLRSHEVLFSQCSRCTDALTRTANESPYPTSSAEIQSLLWHLMHIRKKYAAAPCPELRAVFRAKFIYYYPLIYVRMQGSYPLGEGPALGEILANPAVAQDFLSLTLSCERGEDMRLMEVLIKRMADDCDVGDRHFLVEKKDFIVPIRLGVDDGPDVHAAIAWGRGLFDR
jgi:hypothetical protein